MKKTALLLYSLLSLPSCKLSVEPERIVPEAKNYDTSKEAAPFSKYSFFQSSFRAWYDSSRNENSILCEEDIKPNYIRKEDESSLEFFSPELIDRVHTISQFSYESVIHEIKTPLEAAIYTTTVLSYEYDAVIYGKSDAWAKFATIHAIKRDDCEGGAVAAASLLSDDGYQPLIIMVRSESETHAAFVYKNNDGCYGSIGINMSDIQPPNYSLEELAQKLSDGVTMGKINYTILDLNRVTNNFIDDLDDNSFFE